MILGWSTGGRSLDWMPIDGWPSLPTFTIAFETGSVGYGAEEVAQGEAIAAELSRWPECSLCGLEECDEDSCLDCGASFCVEDFHACQGRPGEDDDG